MIWLPRIKLHFLEWVIRCNRKATALWNDWKEQYFQLMNQLDCFWLWGVTATGSEACNLHLQAKLQDLTMKRKRYNGEAYTMLYQLPCKFQSVYYQIKSQ